MSNFCAFLNSVFTFRFHPERQGKKQQGSLTEPCQSPASLGKPKVPGVAGLRHLACQFPPSFLPPQVLQPLLSPKAD